jgi:hypothetical protein
MADETTPCSACGREILRATAERRFGMCAPCHRNSLKSPEVLFEETMLAKIDATIAPFTRYEEALEKLQSLPKGYALCFAAHHVVSEIMNGGAPQLYANSTWPLILTAEQAAREAGVPEVALVLREIVYYHHQKGRSRLERQLGDDFFASIPGGWDKSLKQLNDEFFGVADDAESVVQRLRRDRRELFHEP